MESLRARVLSLIARLSDGRRDDAARDALLCEALDHQRKHVPPYARLCKHHGIGSRAGDSPDAYPALPTDVFRYTRVAAHGPERDVRIFRTSGTTSGARGSHALSDLTLYDAAARSFASHALFADLPRTRIVLLTPSADEAPDSSLSYMLDRFLAWYGTPESCSVWSHGTLHTEPLIAALDRATADNVPLAVLGTSFAFVHAEDQLGARRWSLPAGSRLMQTGGFKGKSREIDASELRAALRTRYGLPDAMLVQEYGMTELCSQMYESRIVDTLCAGPARTPRMLAPGWMRITAVDPDSLQPVATGAVGIARIDDLANLDSVCSIQTADRIRVLDDGFELLGRLPGSVPRGCSLAIEEALS